MDKYLDREIVKTEDTIGFYASRIAAYPLVPPEHVYFSLTNRCCLRCIMCDIPKSPSRPEDELSTAQVKKIILQIKELGVRHLILSGGEPLLREDLIECIRYAKDNGIPWVDIITNGLLCDDQTAQKLVQAGLNHVTISLDGVGQGNDAIRGSGAFQKAAEAIDRLNYYKNKLNAECPTLGINFTILNKNIGDMLKIVEFARSKKCNTVVFQPVLVSNVSMYERKQNKLWPSAKELLALKDNINSLIRIKEKEPGIIVYTDTAILKMIPGYFEGKRPGRSFKCYEGIKRIVITCDGKLWSCSGIYGDLLKDNLKEIWFSPSALNVRKLAAKCRAHCLQDCVYFPLDISGQVEHFLDTIKDSSDNNAARERLVERIDYCVAELSQRLKPNFLGFFSRNRREIHKLNMLKNEILKKQPAAQTHN